MARNEYPRPQFQRDKWLSLNGLWQFDFDDNEVSLKEKWYSNHYKLTKDINVPFCFESKLSGINDKEPHSTVFYKTKVLIPQDWSGQHIILNFGAVDYSCKVFVNGNMVGEHEGGHIGFSFDITDYLLDGEQDISVYVFDPAFDETIPRGKQTWKTESHGIWYTRTTGIWQSVWLEPVSSAQVESVRFTPDVDNGMVMLEAEFIGQAKHIEIEISMKGEVISKDVVALNANHIKRQIDIFSREIFHTNAHGDGWCWTPQNPNLFDVKLSLYDNSNTICDEVYSYFGMRKIHSENGVIYLNNLPIYMKLVLDQGYWPDGLMTAPTDEDFIKDISLSKEMGFNGCRKHQKVEDPRFLYWADKMGYLVWGEMAASCVYTPESANRLTKEWQQIIKRDYNHPCIVAWVPLNESWGVSQIDKIKVQQDHSMSLYYMIKSLDQTRFVVNNDGWQLTKTDICGIHNYAHGGPTEITKYEYFQKVMKSLDLLLKDRSAGRSVYATDFKYQGEPILITECGGIAYEVGEGSGWGYTTAQNQDDFIEQYQRVVEAILASDVLYGFCYTQFTDVEQEINGLLTYDRHPKCDLTAIKEINDMWRHNMVI